MNGQKIPTQKKASDGETQGETQGKAGSESPCRTAGTTGEDAGSHGSEAKNRRRSKNQKLKADAVTASKKDAVRKINAQINALETLKALV